MTQEGYILYLVFDNLITMRALRAASRGDHAELEISKLFEAPYVLSATGTRRYIRERQQHATSKDHVIAWLARLAYW